MMSKDSCCSFCLPCSFFKNSSFDQLFFFKLFILFLVPLSLCCCAWGLSNCSEQGLVFIAAFSLQRLLLLRSTGFRHMVFSSCSPRAPVVAVHWLSCSTACGIFLDQGLNLCFLPGRQIPVCCTTREVHLNHS